MGKLTSVAQAVETAVSDAAASGFWKKAVTVPVKWIAYALVVVVVLAVASSLSRRVEPTVNAFLGPVEPVEAVCTKR